MNNGQQIPVAMAVPINVQPVQARAIQVQSSPYAMGTPITQQPVGVHRVHPNSEEVLVYQERVETNALLAWIGCCCCPIIGLFGVYMSIKAENYARNGDFNESQRAAKAAKQVALFAIISGLCWMFWRPWRNEPEEQGNHRRLLEQAAGAMGTMLQHLRKPG